MAETNISTQAEEDKLVAHETYRGRNIYVKKFSLGSRMIYDGYVEVKQNDNQNFSLEPDISFVGKIYLDGQKLAAKYVGISSIDYPYATPSKELCLTVCKSLVDDFLIK